MTGGILVTFCDKTLSQREQQEEAEAEAQQGDDVKVRGPAIVTSRGPVTVVIEDAESQAFELVLAYIYTDRIHPHATAAQSRDVTLDGNEVACLMMDVYRLALKVHVDSYCSDLVVIKIFYAGS